MLVVFYCCEEVLRSEGWCVAQAGKNWTKHPAQLFLPQPFVRLMASTTRSGSDGPNSIKELSEQRRRVWSWGSAGRKAALPPLLSLLRFHVHLPPGLGPQGLRTVDGEDNSPGWLPG